MSSRLNAWSYWPAERAGADNAGTSHSHLSVMPETQALAPGGVLDAAHSACFHCGSPVGGDAREARVSGRAVSVCGDACRIAVETIAAAGLDDWYRLRRHSDAAGAALDAEFRATLEAWRVPEVEASALRDEDGTARSVSLSIEGMRCAGCAWLVEKLLTSTDGVRHAEVDFARRRAEVRFDCRTTGLSVLVETLGRAGYRAAPYHAGSEEAAIEAERRARIRGIGIASIFSMQVMLVSVALYAGAHYGIEARFEQLFRWLAMGLCVPVLVGPGRLFFTGALAALRARRLTMDVPVALGLGIAFTGSAWATITGEGEIWFDSVVMFVTLLSIARYLELLARRRSTSTIRTLASATPLIATRLGASGAERVPAAALKTGDRVLVRPGETVPSDGRILSGESAFDESLLTGESVPVARQAGERVLAGSVNRTGVVEVETLRTGDATVLGTLQSRAEEAARTRPAIARLADRAAAWFIGAVLVLAGGVAIWWLLREPAAALPVVVSVLVVTCPCALSLATPAAMIAALGALARAGLVVTGANAVERLGLVTHCLADKTGTLTEGKFRLRGIHALAEHSDAECLRLASALERYASHPVAAAFVDAVGSASREAGGGIAAPADGAPPAETEPRAALCGSCEVEDVVAFTDGVTGRIGGVRYAIGSADFIARICTLPAFPDAFVAEGRPTVGEGTSTLDSRLRGNEEIHLGHHLPSFPRKRESTGKREPVGSSVRAPGTGRNGGHGSGTTPSDGLGSTTAEVAATGEKDSTEGDTCVLLARDGALLARFVLADSPREGAKEFVEGLRGRGIATTIASGDQGGAVRTVADALGAARGLAGLTPDDKLREADRLAARGERVLMIGDGVNDAPAIAGAHVSVAMGRGAAAAAARADAVLIGDDPRRLLAGIDIARQTRRVIKQNLAWAAGYNLIALPLAASGAVPPWAAAIGMSLSSLAVAGNALRLGRRPGPGD